HHAHADALHGAAGRRAVSGLGDSRRRRSAAVEHAGVHQHCRRRAGGSGGIERPRWFSFPGTDPATLSAAAELRMEAGFPVETAATLTARGHAIREMGEMESGGGSQAILIEDGVLYGGSDSRVDGCGIGY